MSIHFFARLEPVKGKEPEFRGELLRVLDPTRGEPGCFPVRVFESLGEPVTFAIHSEWADEAAFERHSQLPHTAHFLKAAAALSAHPVEGLRTREIRED